MAAQRSPWWAVLGRNGHEHEAGTGLEGGCSHRSSALRGRLFSDLNSTPGRTEEVLSSLPDYTPTAPRPCCSAPRVPLLAILWKIAFVLTLAGAFPHRLNSAGSNYCPHKVRLFKGRALVCLFSGASGEFGAGSSWG